MFTDSNPILVPTDFSEICLNGADYAAELAKASHKKILLLHVINKETRTWIKKGALPESTVIDKLMEEKSRLEKRFSIEVDIVAKEGSIFAVIPQVSRDYNVVLTVFSTSGKTGIHRLRGNRTLRIIERSPVPVLSLSKKGAFKNNNILLPLFAHIEYKPKLEWALFFAKNFGAETHLFVAKEPYKNAQKILTEISAEFATAFAEAALPLHLKFAENSRNNLDQLLKYAKAIDAGLIIIMTDNDQFEPGFILPSLDEKVLENNQHIPVLSINPTEK